MILVGRGQNVKLNINFLLSLSHFTQFEFYFHLFIILTWIITFAGVKLQNKSVPSDLAPYFFLSQSPHIHCMF